MRNMSFALTTAQMRARTKTVTRRLGWRMLKPVDLVMACEKCQGLQPGQPLVRIHAIEIVKVSSEPLAYLLQDPLRVAAAEVALEGFPDMTPEDFVTFFCASHDGCTRDTWITRIEFKHLP